MRLIFTLIFCLVISLDGYTQSPDELALFKRLILKTIVKDNRASNCTDPESTYSTIIIQFSKYGYPKDVFFYGSNKCFTKSDEIRQELLTLLSVQIRIERKSFSNAYVVVPLLISKNSQIAQSAPEVLKVSESWASSFKDFDAEVFRKKHLKYIIPIEVVIYPSTHRSR